MDTTTAPPPVEYEDNEPSLPFIPIIAAFFRWLEELITVLSGYAITAALAIGVVDLLTDGRLTADNPNIDFAYAISMAAGIGGQIVGLSYRSSRAFSQRPRQIVQGVGFLALVAVLAYVEYISGIVFAYHKTFGEPVTQSLGNLGIGQRDFIQLRTGVAIGLTVLSGFLRYQKPRRKKSLAELELETQREIRLAELAAQKRAANVGGFMGTLGAVTQQARQAIATPAQPIENTAPPAAPVRASSNGHGPSSGLAKLPQDYTADDPAFAKYDLPNDITLTSTFTLSEMARRLGLSKSTLSTAWNAQGMDYEVATGDQPVTAMNIAVYQVLALVEAGMIALPANVRVLAAI